MLDSFTRSHLTVARIAGIPVGLNYSWFAVCALVVWTLGEGYFRHVVPGTPEAMVWAASSAGTLLFFGSILAHEFGHALAAQAFGIPCRGVTLFALGGVSRIAAEPRTAREELVIAGAGPVVSFFLALLFAGLALFGSRGAPVFAALTTYLALVNAGLAIFNLLPALPLDGGRILRAVLWHIAGDPWRAMRWSATAGRFCGLSFVSLGVVSGLFGGAMWGVWLVLVGLFIERSANGSAKHAREAQADAVRDAFLEALAARANLQTAAAVLPEESQGGANVDERTWRAFGERVVQWRARLDTLPRPGDIDTIGPEGGDVDQEVGRRYLEDRLEMYRVLDDVDLALRSRIEDGRIEHGFARLGELYSRWEQPAGRNEAVESDPADAVLAGRPERFAPNPEDALSREPGSSIEV